MATLDTPVNLDSAGLAYRAAAARAEGLATAAGIPLGGSPAKTAALKKAAQDFEAMFMSTMLESMTAGLKTDKMFGGGPGEQMYRSLLNQEYGKAMASTGSLGLAPAIERAMLQAQEAGQK
jgi:Rod binding domain-containing protein